MFTFSKNKNEYRYETAMRGFEIKVGVCVYWHTSVSYAARRKTMAGTKMAAKTDILGAEFNRFGSPI